MNDMISTSSAGTRRRCRPVSTARRSVVAASSSEVRTPSVALTSKLNADSSPLADRLMPSTSTRGPSANTGISSAATTNGASTTDLLSRNPGGTRAIDATPASSTAYAAKAQRSVEGVATTSTMNVSAATIFAWGASTCTRV